MSENRRLYQKFGRARDVRLLKGQDVELPSKKEEALWKTHKDMSSTIDSTLSDWRSIISSIPVGMTQYGLGSLVSLSNLGVGQLKRALPHLPISMPPKNPFLGMKWWQDFYARNPVGKLIKGPPPTTAASRAVVRGGEEIGASLLPYGGMAAAARTGSKIRRLRKPITTGGESVRQPITTAGAVTEQLLKPIRKRPATTFLGESVLAGSAGVSGSIAQELFPDSPVTEQMAKLAGGTLPSMLPSAWATRIAQQGIRNVRAAPTKQAQKAVKGVLGGMPSPEARVVGLSDEIPGFKPPLAAQLGKTETPLTVKDIEFQTTVGDPALTATTIGVEARASGEALNKIHVRRQDSDYAIEKYRNAKAPDPNNVEPSPEVIVDMAANKIDDLVIRTEAQEKLLQQKRVDLAAEIPEISRLEKGQQLRSKYNEIRANARADMNRAAGPKGFNVNNIDIRAQINPMQKIVRRFLPKIQEQLAEPELPIIKEFFDANPNKSFTFQTLKAYRQRVSGEIFEKMHAGKKNDVRRLVGMLKGIDKIFERLPGLAGWEYTDPDFLARYVGFRQHYKENYIDRFDKAAAYKVRKLGERGFYQTPDEKVAELFFSPNNISAAQQFKAIYRDDAGAMNNLEAVALDSLRQAAVRNGEINANSLANWIRKHKSVLNEFPSLNQKVTGIARAEKALLIRSGELSARRKEIQNKALAKELDKYQKTTKTAQDVIDVSLKDPRRMGQLVNRIKSNPDILEALRRNIWDRATGGEASDIISFMADNQSSLKLLFSQEHFKHISNIALARSMSEVVPTARGTGFQAVPLKAVEEKIGQKLQVLGSRMFALQTGRVQAEYLYIDAGLRSLRNRSLLKADIMLREALYDPEIAKSMSNALTLQGASQKEALRLLYARTFGVGIPPIREAVEDDEEPPAWQGTNIPGLSN
jgi:hypothetical protein